MALEIVGIGGTKSRRGRRNETINTEFGMWLTSRPSA